MPTTYTATRPTHLPAQTLNQAKRDYKANGPRISTQQTRQIARGVELYERAERIKEAELRKKQNAKRKAAREERERESRRRMGIPSPSKQVKKVSASQGLLVGFVKVLGATKADGGESFAQSPAEEDREIEDYMDGMLDEDSLLEVLEDKSIEQQPVISLSEQAKYHGNDAELRHSPKEMAQQVAPTLQTKASTSFTEKTDFVLAREIAWTQDIEAARSFDAARKPSPDRAGGPRCQKTVNIMEQELWDDFDISNTQLAHELVDEMSPSPYSKVSTPVAKAKMQHTSNQLADPVIFDHSALTSMSRTVEEDTFLSMLSTQDLNFSSPSSGRQISGAGSGSASAGQQSIKSPSLSLSPLDDFDIELDFDAMLMPPPPLPARPIFQHRAPSASATTSMPPPPRPVSAIMPPPPRPPKAKVNFSLPAQTASSGIGRASVQWLPSDFDLSTQDCREIGI